MFPVPNTIVNCDNMCYHWNFLQEHLIYIVMSHESWVSGDPLGEKDHVCHTWERLELENLVTASETNQHYQTVGHFMPIQSNSLLLSF